MANETKRYLVPANGPEVEPIRIALALLAKLCEDLGKSAILLIPAKQSIQGTTLETALGTNAVKSLLQGRSVKLPGGGNLRLKTQRTFQDGWTSDIIMGVYVTRKMLNQIDSADDAAAVIIVPWVMDDVKEWRRTWNPQVLGEEPAVTEKLIENPVVEEALKMLTDLVNLQTGLSHPSDKAAAVDLFRRLYKNQELYDPDSIRAWALRNGWTPDGADQLRSVSQAILDRRPIRGGRSPLRPDIIKVLRERVKDNQ